jgi:hypothetical protein
LWRDMAVPISSSCLTLVEGVPQTIQEMNTRIRILQPIAAAFLLFAGARATAQQPQVQQPPAQPPSSPTIDERFYTALARGAASTDLEKTKKSGGSGGGAFAEVRPEGAYLVGFDVWEGDWSGHRIIRGMRAIFQTATGRIRGSGHGHTSGHPSKVVEANEGYAVAAMEVRGGDRLDGFQLLFWKIRPAMWRLDADASYRSDWIGGSGGGKARNALSSDGRPVLGIFGASGSDMDRLGLIYLPK